MATHFAVEIHYSLKCIHTLKIGIYFYFVIIFRVDNSAEISSDILKFNKNKTIKLKKIVKYF